MLILTRKTGQGFLIGEDIEITITEISGDKVRVGIQAPRSVKVLRSELSETVELNQQAAAQASTSSLRALAGRLKQETPAKAPQQETLTAQPVPESKEQKED